MEKIIQQLQSNEVLVKNKALEDLLDKLQKRTSLNTLQVDAKLRLINTTVMLLKDANPKIVLTAMECVKIYIDQYTIDFQPLVNMSFDILLIKFGDGKLTVRARANETMVALINSIGLSTGYEKLEANIHHKNMRIREQVLHVLQRLFGTYGEGMLVFPNMTAKLATLLRDPQDSIRQLAVETLGHMLVLRGESLMDELASLDVRPASLRAIQAIAPIGQPQPSKSGVPCSPPGTKPSIDIPIAPVPTAKRDDSMSSLGSSVTNTSWSPRENSPALSASARTRTPTIQLSRHISTGSTETQGSASSGDSSAGKFDPVWYLSLIGEGTAALSLFCQSDRELQKSLSEIKAMLQNKDDWEMRFTGLGRLQGLVGDMPCSGVSTDSIAAAIRSTILEEVSAQISDLRSTVSKEACRTVAILARALRSSFALLAELWAPAVLKLVLVKIAVVSSAGDRCMRIVIAAGAPVGFSRLLPLLLETLSSKNPILRKHSLEYLTLAAAIWDPDSTFDRQAEAIKKAVRIGVVDADPHARKCARYLFWVLRRRPAWQRSMDALLSDLDSNIQRNVKTETAQSSELAELLTNGASLGNIDSYEPVFTGGSPVSKSFQRQHEESFAQTARQSRDSAASRDVRSSFNRTAPVNTKSPVPSPPSKQLTRKGAARVSTTSVGKSAAAAPALPPPPGREELAINLDDSMDAPPCQVSSKRMSIAVTGRPQNTSALGTSRRMSVGPTRLAAPHPSSKESGDGMPALPRPTRVTEESSYKIKSADGVASRATASSAAVVDSQPVDSELTESASSALRGGPMRAASQFVPVADDVPGALQSGPKRVAMRVAAPESKDVKVFPPKSAMRVLQTQPKPATLEDEQCESAESRPKVTSKCSVDDSENAETKGKLEAGRPPSGRVQKTEVTGQDRVSSSVAVAAKKSFVQSSARGSRDFDNNLTGDCSSAATPDTTSAVGPSMAEARSLLGDSLWTNRVKGLEAMTARFLRWLSSPSCSNGHPSHLEEILDLCIKSLTDPHHKVTAQAHIAIETLGKNRNTLIISRLGTLLPALFSRMNERRPASRQQASDLVDLIRQVQDPCVIMAAMSPKIIELPERTLTSAFQLLITVAPVCEAYFCQPQNTGAFLNRIAVALSSASGKRPSASALVAGQRLVELVYKTNSEIVLTQISSLPLQHQSTVKTLLKSRVPNIDTLVTAAGRTHWASSHPSDSVSDSRNCTESTNREDALDKSVGEDISVLTCDDDYQTTAAIGEFDEPSGSQDKPYSPKAYLLTPTAAILRSPAVGDDAIDSARKTPPLTPPGKVFPPGPPCSLPKRGMGRRATSPTVNSTPNARPKSDRISASPPTDVVWLIRTLRPECIASRDDKRKAIGELKKLAKSASEEFWQRNCAQIMSVLLEAFNPSLSFVSPAEATSSAFEPDHVESPPAVSDPRLDGNYYSTMPHLVPSLPLTGLSPQANTVNTKSLLHDNGECVDNVTSNEQNSEALLTGKNGPMEENDTARREVMHIACKGLLILVKFLNGDHIKAFMELIVCRLCQAASYAPIAVSLHFEQILSLMAPLDPVCLVRLLLPYLAASLSADVVRGNTSAGNDSSQHTRLLALRALADGVKHLKSSQLISTLPQISTIILPLFSSPLVDIRKSVVFVLVEVYMIVGDELHPYVRDLAPSQRKLLTVYIERQMNRNPVVQSLPVT